MQKFKKLRLPLAAVLIGMLSLPLLQFWLSNWPLSILAGLAVTVGAYIVMCLIRTFIIAVRIEEANTDGDLDKWLADRGLPAHTLMQSRGLVKQLLAIRDNPKSSEQDRRYAAFLTVSAPRKFASDKTQGSLPGGKSKNASMDKGHVGIKAVKPAGVHASHHERCTEKRPLRKVKGHIMNRSPRPFSYYVCFTAYNIAAAVLAVRLFHDLMIIVLFHLGAAACWLLIEFILLYALKKWRKTKQEKTSVGLPMKNLLPGQICEN